MTPYLAAVAPAPPPSPSPRPGEADVIIIDRPTARAPSPPRTGEQQSTKKNWRQRRRRPRHRILRPAAAAPTRPIEQVKQVRLHRAAQPRAREGAESMINSAPLSVLQIFRSVVDDPVARAAPAAADIISSTAAASSVAPIARAPSSPRTGISLKPLSSDIAAQANVGVQGNIGSRSRMPQTTLLTQLRHRRGPVVMKVNQATPCRNE